MRSYAAQFSARVEEIRKLPNKGYLMRPQPMTQRETLINEAGHICLQITLGQTYEEKDSTANGAIIRDQPTSKR